MSNLMIPGPGDVEPDDTVQEQGRDAGDGNPGDGNPGDGANAPHRRGPRQSKKQPIPSLDDCARLMAKLIGMVTIGLMKPAQAGAIRNMLRDLMHYHQGKAKDTEKALSNADVLDLMKKNPAALSLLEPFLTQEQVDMIMRNGNGANGGA